MSPAQSCPQENEEQIGWFLGEHPDFVLMPPETVWSETQSAPVPKSAIEAKDMLQLTPAMHGTDGFFIAILQKS